MADHLNSYKIFRKLGLSLGYAYCHTRLTSTRHLLPNSPPRWIGKVRFFEKAWYWLSARLGKVISRTISRTISQEIYDFLGLNQYFASDKTSPDASRFPKKSCCHITLSDQLLQENNISSYKALERHIKNLVSQRKKPGFPLLLVLQRSIPLEEVSRILHTIPDPTDPLDFRAAYFQRQKKHPVQSGFARGRLKILAHLRLGDRGVAYTPWGTWIYNPPRLYRWRQCPSENDFWQVTATDFYQFMQKLLEHFPPDTTDAQIFSDGFEHTIKGICRRNLIVPPLAWTESRLLEKSLKCQQRLLVSQLKSLPNSTCFIGEKKSQLFKLVHAAVEADLFIAAFPGQSHLLTCLADFYRDRTNMPVVLLLHKLSRVKNTKSINMANNVMKRLCHIFPEGIPGINFVDIDASDFPGLTRQILHQ